MKLTSTGFFFILVGWMISAIVAWLTGGDPFRQLALVSIILCLLYVGQQIGEGRK